ncbi:hypothetical protein ACHQM5_029233 [Ranunculus cassubicifolius]
MRKLFWFKSSSSNTVSSNTFSSPLGDGKVSREETQVSGLRRSRSLSSTSFQSGALEESKFFSCDTMAFHNSNSNIQQSSDYPVCNRSLNPERQQFDMLQEKSASQRECPLQNFNSPGSSKQDYGSSGNSSCSSRFPRKCESARFDHASSEVLDLYIDGEQKNRNSRTKVSSSPRKSSSHGSRSGRRPPRIHTTVPGSPPCNFSEIPGSHSIKQIRDSSVHLVTRDSTVNEFGIESPQKLAKNVVKRLSQVSPCKSKVVPRDTDLDTPTTVEDIYEYYIEPNGPSSDFPSSVYSLDTEDVDLELQRKVKNAADRVELLSEELESENSFTDHGYNVSSLYQIIRNLLEERRSLALEVSGQLQCRIADRASAKEALRVAKVEMDSQTVRLEKEKNELQSGLEKELDRRSSDWSFKIQKIQLEEKRLRERVRELAEQNVSLQREVSFLNGREGENMNRISRSEQHLKDLKSSLEEITEEKLDLDETLANMQEQLRNAESNRDSLHRSFKEKERENKELHKAIARLQRTCSEQEKTIIGLRQVLGDELENKHSSGISDGKLQMEQVRLTGVEQSLRKEVESFRLEVESLRRENVALLDRLRCTGEASGSSSFRLDQELQSRVECLQKQGTSLISQSNELCEKLLELIKAKGGQRFDDQKNGWDGYLVVEMDMKVQSLKAGSENLKRSLQTIASVLHKRSESDCSPSQSWKTEIVDSHGQGNELRAEIMLTSVLRDKLFVKQMEVDQLQSELATAIRGHDILRCEVQATEDAVSSMSHSMKDLELQMMRKDETINRLDGNLQDCSKELSILKGVLSKVSKERDNLWEEVKDCSEKNMLLNSEVDTLRKKIEFLDEEVAVKEGQITILKDSLKKKPFDILSTNSY